MDFMTTRKGGYPTRDMISISVVRSLPYIMHLAINEKLKGLPQPFDFAPRTSFCRTPSGL